MPKGRWIREMGSPSSGPSIPKPPGDRQVSPTVLSVQRRVFGPSLVFSPILASPVADNAETTNLQLWPPYPGFDSALHADWPAKPTRTHTLDDHALEEAAQKGDAHQRAFQVVTRFLDGIEDFRRSAEERIDLAICVVPEYVWRNCRPLSHVIAPVGSPLPLKERKRRASGQLDLSRSYEPEPYRYSVDFRRQLKARSMYLADSDPTYSGEHFEDR